MDQELIRFLLFGLLLVPPSLVHNRTMVSVAALESIDAQSPPRGEDTSEPYLRIDSPRPNSFSPTGEA